MADGPTWRLSGARAQAADDDSDDDAQKKSGNANNRRRRRKPLPPIDVLGPASALSTAPPSAFLPSANPVAPHASAFSVPKPRHHFIASEDGQQTSGSSGATSLHFSPVQLQTTGASNSFVPMTSPTATQRQRGTSPSAAQSPLAAASASSRTVTVCCCIQVQFEGGNRRCTRSVLWLIIITSLICIFSVITVLLSYYSVDLFQPRTRGGRSVFKKLAMAASSSSSTAPEQQLDADSWLTSAVSVPSEAANRVDPEALLGLFQRDLPSLSAVQTYLSASSKWAEENLVDMPPRVFQPYGTEFVTARGLFPDARAVVLLNTWPSGSLKSSCDASCKSKAADLASQALVDLEKEGFITSSTLRSALGGGGADSVAMGMLPFLLASVRAAGAQAVHAEERAWPEAGLSCVKLHAQAVSHHHGALTLTYCGGLNEASEPQRLLLRTLLRPVQPWSTLIRSANYALHPDVLLGGPDLTALAHFKALILSISGAVVQDDSGVPFAVLTKHETDVAVFGEYKGLGDRELSGLGQVPDAVVKSLYQPALASKPQSGPLPFRFGYSKVIGPAASDGSNNKFIRRQDFKGSHLIVARKKASTATRRRL